MLPKLQTLSDSFHLKVRLLLPSSAHPTRLSLPRQGARFEWQVPDTLSGETTFLLTFPFRAHLYSPVKDTEEQEVFS